MAKRLQDKPEHWSDVVGMPDDWDKQNITTIIDNFCKQKYKFNGKWYTGQQWIVLAIRDAKRSHQQESGGFNPKNIKIKDSDMRALLAMPPPLNATIVEAYPTMFRDRKHTYWFAKNFPVFLIAQEL